MFEGVFCKFMLKWQILYESVISIYRSEWIVKIIIYIIDKNVILFINDK